MTITRISRVTCRLRPIADSEILPSLHNDGSAGMALDAQVFFFHIGLKIDCQKHEN